MFHTMWNRTISGTPSNEIPSGFGLIDDVYKTLRARFPSSWQLSLLPQLDLGNRTEGSDYLLEITSRNGVKAVVDIETTRQVEPKDVPRLQDYRQRARGSRSFLVIAPFLSPRTRDLLTEAKIDYADATGNFRLELEKPALFIMLTGADKSPWREERALQSLKGPAAGRTVRALCDFSPAYGIRELAERSNTPVASISRVVAFLARETLLMRDNRGAVIDVNWKQLILRWTDDYSLITSNQTRNYLEPRGIESLLRKLEASNLRYAVTGSLAAIKVASIAPPRLAVIYVENIGVAADQLNLRPVESGTNVLLSQPFDSVVFDRVTKNNGIIYAALSQVAADLITSPGRGPTEGEGLLKWMEENESEWRS